MATSVQRRRGTAAQVATFVGVNGELIVDTTNKTLVVMDGVTAGGSKLAVAAEVNAQIAQIADKKSVPLASAATVNLDNASGDFLHITGTTTITALLLPEGLERDVVFDGVLTLTHGASLLLPGGANIVTAPGDRATFRSEGLNVLRCMHYTKANGIAIVASPVSEATFIADTPITASGKAVVLGSNGKVRQSAIAGALTSGASFYNGTLTPAAALVFEPVIGKYIIFYQDGGDANKGKARIVQISTGGAVSYGTPEVFATAINGDSVSLAACYDPITSQIIVAFRDRTSFFLIMKTVKLTGDVFTFGAETVVNGASSDCFGVCYDKSVSRLLVSYREGAAQKVTVGTVTGTALSFGATATLTANANGYTGSVVHCDSLATNAAAVNEVNIGRVRQVKIDPTTFALTIGTVYTVASSAGEGGTLTGTTCLAWVDSIQRLAAVFDAGAANNYSLVAALFAPNGAGWAFAASSSVAGINFSSPFQHHRSIDYSARSNTLCVSYSDVNASFVGKISFSSVLTQTSLTFSATNQFLSLTTDMTAVCANHLTSKVLVATFDNTNPTPAADQIGYAVVFDAPEIDRRANFIGFAKASAIEGAPVTVKLPFGVDTNQTGLTPNGLYYLSATDGTSLTTAVNGPAVGRALSSTSVLVLGTNVFP